MTFHPTNENGLGYNEKNPVGEKLTLDYNEELLKKSDFFLFLSLVAVAVNG